MHLNQIAKWIFAQGQLEIPTEGWKQIVALEEKDYGDISVSALKQDGKDVYYEVNETILLARLNKPLLPGKNKA